MKTKWKIIIPILIVAALAAAFFLQGNEPAEPAAPAEEAYAAAQQPVSEVQQPAAEVQPPVIETPQQNAETQQSEETPPAALQPTAESQQPAVEAQTPVTETHQQTAETQLAAPQPAAEVQQPSSEAPAVPAAAPENTETLTPEEPAPMEVTISISCASINNNIADLDPAKTGLVPSDGWLLKAVKVEFNEGESVFNVLQRVCKQNKIHMEFMNTPVYNSAYIEGIGNLYEFDCGPLSGWMYSVNDWYPNYGCSRYELKPGDVICWRYTCDLGSDIGGGYLENFQKDD